MQVTFEKDGKEIERFEAYPTEEETAILNAKYNKSEIKSLQLDFIEGTLVEQTFDLGELEENVLKAIKIIL